MLRLLVDFYPGSYLPTQIQIRILFCFGFGRLNLSLGKLINELGQLLGTL